MKRSSVHFFRWTQFLEYIYKGYQLYLDNFFHTFKLKHGQDVKFTGLPVGTKISVTESATPNYKGSAERTFNGVAQTKIEATKYDEAITVTNTLGQKQNKVAVTNTYNYVPTTGIIMNTLPYVLMVVLCAAALFGFVAFKRKKVQK